MFSKILKVAAMAIAYPIVVISRGIRNLVATYGNGSPVADIVGIVLETILTIVYVEAVMKATMGLFMALGMTFGLAYLIGMFVMVLLLAGEMLYFMRGETLFA